MIEKWSWASLPVGAPFDTTQINALKAELNIRMKRLEHALQYLQGLIVGVKSGSGATPSVSGTSILVTSNAAPVNLTAFANGEPGQLLVVVMGDANTTVKNSANLMLAGAIDWAPVLNQSKLFATQDGSAWAEVPYF